MSLEGPDAGYSFMSWAKIQFGVLGDETSQILRSPIAPERNWKWMQTSNNWPVAMIQHPWVYVIRFRPMSLTDSAHSTGRSHYIFASTFSVPPLLKRCQPATRFAWISSISIFNSLYFDNIYKLKRRLQRHDCGFCKHPVEIFSEDFTMTNRLSRRTFFISNYY